MRDKKGFDHWWTKILSKRSQWYRPTEEDVRNAWQTGKSRVLARIERLRKMWEDGKTVWGLSDEEWRKDNPPKPDASGLTQQRRMAFKDGYVRGWLACLEAFEEIK